MRAIKAGLLGGAVLFVWSFISWTLLPWHNNVVHTFKDQKAVVQTLKSNAPLSGIYVLPSMDMNAKDKNMAGAPLVFSSINLAGVPTSMTMPMVYSFIEKVVAAFLVAWLLLRAKGLGYVGRVTFVVVFGLAAGITCLLPCLIWFGFDLNYTLISLADLLIGWYFAGLVLAGMCKNN